MKPIYYITFIIALLISPVLAAQPQTIALTELEQKQVADAAQAEAQAEADFRQRANEVIAAPLAQAVEVKHYFETASLRWQIAQLSKKLVIAELKAKYLCPNCSLTEDGKGLLKPEKAKN
jgi:hypothetical protein